ncbi:MAG: HEAT repeat domain-containing protein [Planctomycetia bacterium]|nr:HEAT repeat domain-containing protein [Planctomycetia bacterium]
MKSYRQTSAYWLSCFMLCFTSIGLAQTTSLGTVSFPLNKPKAPVESVTDWSKTVIHTANTAWAETNAAQREKLLNAWAEATPSQMAYLTRVLQQNQPAETAQTIQTLKELFGIIRRITWQPADVPAMQRVVAAWVVVVPPLVKRIPSTELSSHQRRNLEQVLLDLALLSREGPLASPVARQTWQAEVKTLATMLQHSKHSVRLVALSVLEALGSDAADAKEQVTKALNDSDCFVRWVAVRTVQALGLTESARQQLTKLENDSDSQVRQAVLAALQKPVTGNDAAMELKSVPTSTKTEVVQQSVVTSVPAKPAESLTNVETPKPALTIREETKLEIPKMEVPARIEVPAKLEIPKVEVPAVESRPMPKPAMKVETSSPAKPAPLTALPVQRQIPVRKPVAKELPATSSPMFGPAPTPVSQTSTRPTVQQTAAVAPVNSPAPVKPAPTSLWLSRLRQGSVEQQVNAVMELGKLGASASDAIPVLSEFLLRGDVAVRREIPLALAKMGKPARMATAVLERALQDQDTDVKVNAARALLELSE